MPQVQPHETRDWRARLADLIRLSPSWDFPWKAYRPRRPSGKPWPKGLPSSATLRDFYALCDGGPFDWVSWLRLRQLKPAAKQMAEQVQVDRDFFRVDQEPFDVSRQLVLAEQDGEMFPLVWDSRTNRLAWYQTAIDGGLGWNSHNATLEEFLTGLFFPEPGTTFARSAMWIQVIQRLETVY